MAREYQVPFFETSAKDGLNITDMFYHLARMVLENNRDILNETEGGLGTGIVIR